MMRPFFFLPITFVAACSVLAHSTASLMQRYQSVYPSCAHVVSILRQFNTCTCKASVDEHPSHTIKRDCAIYQVLSTAWVMLCKSLHDA